MDLINKFFKRLDKSVFSLLSGKKGAVPQDTNMLWAYVFKPPLEATILIELQSFNEDSIFIELSVNNEISSVANNNISPAGVSSVIESSPEKISILLNAVMPIPPW